MERDVVWYDDVRVLPKRWQEFFPKASMSTAERTNAIIRLIIYIVLALYLYKPSARYIVVGAVAVASVSLLHKNDPPKPLAETFDAMTGPPLVVKTECKKSTPENPFANYLLTDDPLGPPACPYDQHAKEIRENFNKTLFRDASDIYERQNSQRQFMTMPNTQKIPDTRAFAEFLTGGPSRPTCKEQSSVCTGFRP